MFVGHIAVALAAKPLAPRTSAGWLAAAANWPDLVWPFFLFAGIESIAIVPGITAMVPLDLIHIPWSHSLLAGLVWGLLLAALRRTAVLLPLVLSHWLLDFVTHRPDMPLWPGSALFGLGLWHSLPASLAVEGALWVAALVYFARTHHPHPKRFWSLIALLTLVWLASVFGPPPPHTNAVAGSALAAWLVPFWLAWSEQRDNA